MQSGDTLKNSRLRRDVESTADEDRISRLPDELTTRIFDNLPTKDGAVLSTTSKRMRTLFRWSTKLEFDDSPIFHCSTRPRLTERFPAFQTFVDAVLQASLSPKLDSFRLSLGGDTLKRGRGYEWELPCKQACYVNMSPSQLNTWMSFPLTRHGIREIDLCIKVRNNTHFMLSPALFTYETLEVLKVDVNIDVAQVCASPNFRLPKLKLLHLTVCLIPEEDFISKLVSSCPSLEELYVRAELKIGDSIAVSSSSLRRLTLLLHHRKGTLRNVVLIDTPNLQHLTYSDNLAKCYSITSMTSLVQASFEVLGIQDINDEACFRKMLSLLKAANNVQVLTLGCLCLQVLDLDMLNDCLPVFRNLKQLVLSHSGYDEHRWHTLLLGFLNHSPSLETLDFRNGLKISKIDEVDRRAFETTQEIPSCCVSSLKRILISSFKGLEPEVQVLRFLLRNALVLEEVVVTCCYGAANQALIQDMPRASTTCSVQVIAVRDIPRGMTFY